jgi:hypothetical protein
MMLVRYFEQSTIRPVLIVCPHCEVPPPRAVTGTFSSRAMAMAFSASYTVFGTITPAGII